MVCVLLIREEREENACLMKDICVDVHDNLLLNMKDDVCML